MTDEQLAKGRYLQEQIAKANYDLERLNSPGFFIQLHQNNNFSLSASLIATIGIGESCEHPLAPLATAFHTAVVEHYQSEIQKLKAQYIAL